MNPRPHRHHHLRHPAPRQLRRRDPPGDRRQPRAPGVESFYFLADYHALIKVQDPARVQRSTLEIAASWLACGLDPDKVWFYRQSDIPEIPELTWLLTCVAGKGLLNRAHAYKAAVDRNRADGEDDDAGITAGPVHVSGADGRRHPAVQRAQGAGRAATRCSTSRWRATSASASTICTASDYFALPEAVIEEHVATLPGLDGRKMSKSYDNTIPLFAPREAAEEADRLASSPTRARRARPKDAEARALFQLYQAFAGAEETARDARGVRRRHRLGRCQAAAVRAHRCAKSRRCARRYEALIAQPAAHRGDSCAMARAAARAVRDAVRCAQLREAVGLRDLVAGGHRRSAKAATKAALPQFKQYREADGRFYFKLRAGDGGCCCRASASTRPREAGQLHRAR